MSLKIQKHCDHIEINVYVESLSTRTKKNKNSTHKRKLRCTNDILTDHRLKIQINERVLR